MSKQMPGDLKALNGSGDVCAGLPGGLHPQLAYFLSRERVLLNQDTLGHWDGEGTRLFPTTQGQRPCDWEDVALTRIGMAHI